MGPLRACKHFVPHKQVCKQCSCLICIALKQGLFYPLELAWTRLAADTSKRGAPRTYQGLLHCLQTTARLEGVPGAC